MPVHGFKPLGYLVEKCNHSEVAQTMQHPSGSSPSPTKKQEMDIHSVPQTSASSLPNPSVNTPAIATSTETTIVPSVPASTSHHHPEKSRHDRQLEAVDKKAHEISLTIAEKSKLEFYLQHVDKKILVVKDQLAELEAQLSSLNEKTKKYTGKKTELEQHLSVQFEQYDNAFKQLVGEH